LPETNGDDGVAGAEEQTETPAEEWVR